MQCVFCKSDISASEQGWTLSNYHGWWGRCCSSCYENISHDSWGNPKYPDRLLLFTIKHSDKMQP